MVRIKAEWLLGCKQNVWLLGRLGHKLKKKNQNTQEVKNEHFLIWTRQTKCTFSANFAFGKAMNGQTDVSRRFGYWEDWHVSRRFGYWVHVLQAEIEQALA